MFPCFDQPDLKARLSLKVITIEGWVAVSNAPEKIIHKFNLQDYNDKEKSKILNGADAINLIDEN